MRNRFSGLFCKQVSECINSGVSLLTRYRSHIGMCTEYACSCGGWRCGCYVERCKWHDACSLGVPKGSCAPSHTPHRYVCICMLQHSYSTPQNWMRIRERRQICSTRHFTLLRVVTHQTVFERCFMILDVKLLLTGLIYIEELTHGAQDFIHERNVCGQTPFQKSYYFPECWRALVSAQGLALSDGA